MKFTSACFKIARNDVEFNIILQILFLPITLEILDILYVEEPNQYSAIRD
jgi:hypothetical protein